MSSIIFSGGFFIIVLLLLAIPLGKYISEILQGKTPKFVKFLEPVEKLIYKGIGKSSTEKMTAKKYVISVMSLTIVSFIFLFLILLFQGILPLNSNKVDGLNVSLAFNTAISFITNTNWQAYVGEESMSLFSQIFGLTVQNFISPAIGIAVLTVLI